MNLKELEKLEEKAPPGAFSTFDSEILMEDVKNIPKGGVYVEIGVDKGKSLAIARQVARKDVEVIGVDLRKDPKIKGTTFLRQDSTDGPAVGLSIDVLFIDGDHTYEGCKADMEAWMPYVKEGGVVLFHDCDESSPGVVWAVAEYVSTHRVNKWELFKRTDRNTSVSRMELP